jgi:hypothetical protein
MCWWCILPLQLTVTFFDDVTRRCVYPMSDEFDHITGRNGMKQTRRHSLQWMNRTLLGVVYIPKLQEPHCSREFRHYILRYDVPLWHSIRVAHIAFRELHRHSIQ